MKKSLLTACLMLIVLLGACAPVSSTNTPAAPGASASTAPAAAPTGQPTGVTTYAPGVASTASPAGSPAAPVASTAMTGGAPTAGPTAGPAGIPAGDFQNPVLTNDFPDPDVIQTGNTFYAYATNANGKNIQVARSTDAVHWELLPDALPALPTWAQLGGSLVWAPGVIQLGDRFVMYYTARDTASNKQCIGVAVSDKPEGKFKDTNDHAFVCQADQGGSIDPQPFQDDGKLYLYWKNDGNCCSLPTDIWVQELSADGLSLAGQPKALTDNSQPWEGNLIEAPSMEKHDGKYYLFFSANDYASLKYAVGYATCQSATGPCQQAEENPVLKSKMTPPLVIGPGGESIIDIGGQTWMFYHAWDVVGGTRGDARFMWLDRVDWQNGKPAVQGPTTDPEPEPAVKP